MHALTILQRRLPTLLAAIHARRLATLLDAVAATVCGPRLTLIDIGQRFDGEATLRNRIKCAGRLLGNIHLQGQARMIYLALAQNLLRGVTEPLILIDWSDLKVDQSLHLLRASLPVGGRSLTLHHAWPSPHVPTPRRGSMRFPPQGNGTELDASRAPRRWS
jgi:hypothetical protein